MRYLIKQTLDELDDGNYVFTETRSIQMAILDNPNRIYIFGSNEISDWPVNLAGLVKSPAGHPGYMLNAHIVREHIKKLIDERILFQPFYIMGTSFGGATTEQYMRFYGEDDRMCLGGISTASPPSFPYWHFKKLKKTYIYHKEDDPVRLSPIFFWYKWPRAYREELPGTYFKNPIDNHKAHAYRQATQ